MLRSFDNVDDGHSYFYVKVLRIPFIRIRGGVMLQLTRAELRDMAEHLAAVAEEAGVAESEKVDINPRATDTDHAASRFLLKQESRLQLLRAIAALIEGHAGMPRSKQAALLAEARRARESEAEDATQRTAD